MFIVINFSCYSHMCYGHNLNWPKPITKISHCCLTLDKPIEVRSIVWVFLGPTTSHPSKKPVWGHFSYQAVNDVTNDPAEPSGVTHLRSLTPNRPSGVIS